MYSLHTHLANISKNILTRAILSFAIIILSGLISANRVYAVYQPPIGIPAPQFGIDEPTYNSVTHCPNWPTATNSIAGGKTYDCYYVDNSSGVATDASNTYGYPNKPRLTLPTGTFTAGAYVDIRGGITTPYSTGSDRFYFRGTGTASNYILISGKKAASNPILNKFVHIGGNASATVSYIIFENITINTISGGLDIRPTSTDYDIHHIAVRSSKIDGLVNGKVTSSGFQQFYVAGISSVSGSADIVFYNNIVEHAGNWQPATIDETIGFHVGSYVTRIWMLDNSTWRTGNCGYGHGHAANGTTRYVYVGRNTCSESGKSCADFKEVKDLVISENTFHNPGPPGTGGSGQCIITHYGPSIGPDKSWILFNTLYDCDYGIQTANYSGDTWIIGNVFYKIWQRCADTSTTPWITRAAGHPSCTAGHGDVRVSLDSSYSRGAAIMSYSQNGTVYVVDNTFYDYEKGVEFDNANAGQNVVIHGNIFSGRNQPLGYEVHANYPARTAIDYNEFYYSGGNARFIWGGPTYAGVAALKTGSSKCANCKEGDPLFVSPTIGDFKLKYYSPAINASVENIVYNTFFTLYGLDIRKDRNGEIRPKKLVWDIGAYEYALPEPPTNLRISN